MIKFIRTNSDKWNNVNKDQYKDSIVFVEDKRQIWSNNILYEINETDSLGLDKVEFDSETIILEPDKFYYCNSPLELLDIELVTEEEFTSTYFLEFMCNDTCVILPSNIKWENNIVPDFTQTAIMTIKIQDDTAYLIDCRKLYYVSYSAPIRTQPNRDDAFGSNIIAVTDNMFILDGPATEIKEGAFEGNNDLTSIEIPSTVEKIGSQAFSNCSNLETIYYKGDLSDWNKIEISDDWKEGTDVESIECADGELYLGPCVTFTAQQDNELGFYVNPDSSIQPTIEYSYDKQIWNTLTEEYVSVPSGSNLYCRGINPNGISPGYDEGVQNYFISTGQFNISGDIMTLIDYKHSVKEMVGTMMCLFGRNEDDYVDIVDASNLILSAETLTSDCYQNMFDSCANMVYPPQIKATTLAPYCCKTMFYSCRSLIESPRLLATVLDHHCYQSMFAHTQAIPDVSNINFYDSSTWNGGLYELFTYTNVTDFDLMNILPVNPETGRYWLPATELADWCYGNMFHSCTSLTTAPELPATKLTYYCYGNMFHSCTSLTTAPELPATTLADYCYSDMFAGCSSLVSAPELPATVLEKECYEGMFEGCTSLLKAPELPATELADYCYSDMFAGCTNLTTAPELPATTLTSRCYRYMFDSCTSLTTAPELPATTLADYCYLLMFRGCNKLNHIKCLATDISATNCTYNWVNRVTETGTFIKHPDMTSWSTGSSGIPSGWTVENAEL